LPVFIFYDDRYSLTILQHNYYWYPPNLKVICCREWSKKTEFIYPLNINVNDYQHQIYRKAILKYLFSRKTQKKQQQNITNPYSLNNSRKNARIARSYRFGNIYFEIFTRHRQCIAITRKSPRTSRSCVRIIDGRSGEMRRDGNSIVASALCEPSHRTEPRLCIEHAVACENYVGVRQCASINPPALRLRYREMFNREIHFVHTRTRVQTRAHNT